MTLLVLHLLSNAAYLLSTHLESTNRARYTITSDGPRYRECNGRRDCVSCDPKNCSRNERFLCYVSHGARNIQQITEAMVPMLGRRIANAIILRSLKEISKIGRPYFRFVLGVHA